MTSNPMILVDADDSLFREGATRLLKGVAELLGKGGCSCRELHELWKTAIAGLNRPGGKEDYPGSPLGIPGEGLLRDWRQSYMKVGTDEPLPLRLEEGKGPSLQPLLQAHFKTMDPGSALEWLIQQGWVKRHGRGFYVLRRASAVIDACTARQSLQQVLLHLLTVLHNLQPRTAGHERCSQLAIGPYLVPAKLLTSGLRFIGEQLRHAHEASVDWLVNNAPQGSEACVVLNVQSSLSCTQPPRGL